MKSISLLFLITFPVSAAVSVNLPGVSETGNWARFSPATHPGYNTFSTASNPWPAPVAAVGSGAMLNKLSGSGYFSGGNFIYTAGVDGTFGIRDDSPLAAIRTLIFQGAISGDVTTIALNYNGGTQSLAADYFLISDNVAPAYDDYVWQWDLSGIGNPITSYEVVFGGHIAMTSLQVKVGDTFVQVIPEPSIAVLVAGAGLLTSIRRRRA